MKLLNKIVAVGLFSLLAIGCSKDDHAEQQTNAVTQQKAGEITSPTGYVIAESLSELQKELFGTATNVAITNIEFIDRASTNGAVAIISYNQAGVSKNLGYAIGDVHVGYRAQTVTFAQHTSLTKFADTTVYKCSGSGCCYVGGETNLNGGSSTFYCKCEGNPNGNSGCSMSVTTTKSLKAD